MSHGFTRGFGIEAGTLLYHHVGDIGVGLRVNGSITPVEIEYVVPAGFKVALHRITGYLSDTGVFTMEKYGAGDKLTNGIKVELLDAADVMIKAFAQEVTGSLTIKSNAHWTLLAGSDAIPFNLTGTTGFPIRWTLVRSTNDRGVMMRSGDKFRFTVQDDLTGLAGHELMLQGVISPTEPR